MEIASYIVVFVLLWWLILFMVLPWGIEMEGPNKVGNLPGAPKHHNLKRKLLITTVVALSLTAVGAVMIQSKVIDFRGQAQSMFAEDYIE